jgi:hypothetical protein
MLKGSPIMDENSELLSKISEYSGLFFTPEEIAILLEMNLVEFKKCLRNKDSKTYKAYMMGKLTTMAEIRKNQITLARNGSPNAETLIEKLRKEQDLSETNL